jgi:hypothetical protein
MVVYTDKKEGVMKRVLLFVAMMFAMLPLRAYAESAQRCFPETNFCIEGEIRTYWEQNGGLPVFGFPIAPQSEITVDGKQVVAQRFERNRLELHPENKRPYNVLLGRLGVDRLVQQGRDWFAFPVAQTPDGCRVFVETKHAVCGMILQAWRSNGVQLDGKKAISEQESLALFGLPISELQTETLSDGKEYQVQWFERARFELHPENAAPYNVLLGLLGNETSQTQPALVTPPTVKPVALNAANVLAAFKAAGLEAENTYSMGPKDYGFGPYLGRGTRFLIPSLCADCGGRIFDMDSQADLASLEAYYVNLSKASAAFFSWTFKNGNVLLQINGDLPEAQAFKYRDILMSFAP